MLLLKAGKTLEMIFFTTKEILKTDFSNKLLVDRKEMMYPTNVPHLEIFVPHSRLEQLATLV